jgi:hypothetical protein
LQVDRLPQFVIAGQQAPRSLTEVDTKGFGPRFGAAYRLAPNTVIRTGYGIFYDTFRMTYFQDSVENIPFVREDLQTLSPFQWGLPPAEAFFGFLLNDPPINSITPGPNGFNLDFRNAYVQNWNFGVQQQVKNDLVLEVAYTGSKGTRLNYRVAKNLAEPRGNAVIPASVHPQLRRLVPFAIFDNQLITLSNWFSTTSYGFSTYHALLGRFEKRFAGGLTYINSFTWSKSLTNGAPVSGGSNDTGNRPQNMFDLKSEKALAPYHHKLRFVSSVIYDLPFGKGKPLASGVNPIVNQFIGGWQVNGIATFQSGYPVTVRRPGDPLGIGTDSAARPNLVCSPNMPGGDRTINRYFRTECFSAPADRFGNAGTTTVIGPGLNLWDLAVNKNFAVREKTQIQFRAEFFNAFNHPNWNMPGRDFGASAFGVVSSALDPRIIQFGLKLLF